jgi:hypothetical protein
MDVEFRIGDGVGGAERRQLDDPLDSLDQGTTRHQDGTASRVAGS